jgi:large subunit ribosomal protein L21
MYAVVKTGGRQYRVSPGDTFSVEKLEGAPGATIELSEVLMVGGDQTLLGTPLVSGAKVSVVIETQFRGPKILVYKKKRRHKYRKMRGHRSELTRLFVSEITTPSGSVKADSKPHVLDPNREKPAKVAKTKGAELSAAGGEGTEAPAPRKAAGAKKSAGGTKKAASKSGAKKTASKAKAKK